MSRQKESREFRRWRCVMPCRCEGEGLRFNGFIMNLSYGGARIVGKKKLPTEGMEVLVTIRPRLERVELRSRVVWGKPQDPETGLAQIGVEFLEDRQELREKLRAFFPKYHFLQP